MGADNLTQKVGALLLNGGVTLIVAILAFMSQNENTVYRIEQLENKKYPPEQYKENIRADLDRIEQDILRLERFHYNQ